LNLIDTVNETNLLQKADESWITWMKATFAGVVAPGGDRERTWGSWAADKVGRTDESTARARNQPGTWKPRASAINDRTESRSGFSQTRAHLRHLPPSPRSTGSLLPKICRTSRDKTVTLHRSCHVNSAFGHNRKRLRPRL
jgi:hypothetical protein